MDQGTDSTRRTLSGWEIARTELLAVFDALSAEDFQRFTATISKIAGRWFFTGQGRSGLSARMAAMRFMHLGYGSHVVGEATAPSIRRGDALVVVSGSGETPVSVAFATLAQREGAKVLLVTHQSTSPLASIADERIVLRADTSRQFGGTLFEQMALVLLDAIVFELAQGVPDAHATMARNHANLQ